MTQRAGGGTDNPTSSAGQDVERGSVTPAGMSMVASGDTTEERPRRMQTRNMKLDEKKEAEESFEEITQLCENIDDPEMTVIIDDIDNMCSSPQKPDPLNASQLKNCAIEEARRKSDDSAIDLCNICTKCWRSSSLL